MADLAADAAIGTLCTNDEESYTACRALHRRHGTTYYWATKVLPRESQPHVHALYGLCRFADEIVDSFGGVTIDERAAALTDLRDELALALRVGESHHLVLRAVVRTAQRYSLDPELFHRFFASMAQDLSVAEYETYGDLLGYMDGSAAVIGEMMLPILGPTDGDAARPGARDLGLAFQLTNFLRDVAEDLDRGRVYLPQEDLRRFDVDLSVRRVTPQWRALCRFEIDRIRALYRSADRGIALLPPRSAASIRAARVLYSEILDRIEAQEYDVFSRRARVPLPRKLHVAARELLASRGSR